jgi:hypothetical protein
LALAGSASKQARRRFWLAITAATGVVVVSVWATLIPLASSVEGQGAGGVALGIALVPLAFAIAAFGSRRPDWPLSVVKAMGLAILIGWPLAVILDPLSGLIISFAVGAIVTVRRDDPNSLGRRWIAAGIVAVLIALLVRVALPIAVTVGPALPFTAIPLADRP